MGVACTATQRPGRARTALAPVAWGGLLLMLLGFAASQAGTWTGRPLLYDGSPELAGEITWQAGLFLLAASAIGTAIAAKAATERRVWPTTGFAMAAWPGLVMVSSLAALNTFLPAAAWAFGWGEMPANHMTGWRSGAAGATQ